MNGAPWCIKRTDKSSLVMDSLVPLMNHVSDPGSLIMNDPDLSKGTSTECYHNRFQEW